MRDPKIISPLYLTHKIKSLQRKGQRIVFTNGCFDLLHVGHIRLLKKAKKLGDILIVAINTDASTRVLKGKERPIIPLQERCEMIASLNMVDYVTSFNEATPEKIIQKLQPDVLVKGGDYQMNTIVGASFIKQRGGKVVIFPLVKEKSTSQLLKKIKTL